MRKRSTLLFLALIIAIIPIAASAVCEKGIHRWKKTNLVASVDWRKNGSLIYHDTYHWYYGKCQDCQLVAEIADDPTIKQELHDMQNTGRTHSEYYSKGPITHERLVYQIHRCSKCGQVNNSYGTPDRKTFNHSWQNNGNKKYNKILMYNSTEHTKQYTQPRICKDCKYKDNDYKVNIKGKHSLSGWHQTTYRGIHGLWNICRECPFAWYCKTNENWAIDKKASYWK